MHRKRTSGYLPLALSAILITATVYVGVQLMAGRFLGPPGDAAAGPRLALLVSWYALPFVTLVLGALILWLALRLRKRRIELADASERHSAFLDSSPDGVIVIGSDGRVLDMNGTARRQFGCEPGEYGQAFFGELVESFDGVDAEPDGPRRSHQSEEPGVAHCRRLDGQAFLAEVICNPLHQRDDIGYVCYLRDHTRRLAARFVSQNAERRYEALFNDVSDGVFHASADNVVTAANPAFVNMLGFHNEQELLAQRTRIYMSPVDGQGRTLPSADSSEDAARNVRVFARRRDGVQLALLANIRLLRDAKGNVTQSQGTLTQVAERGERRLERTERDEHQRALLTYALELAVVVGADGSVLYASPAAERVLGMPPQRMLGESVFRYLRADERDLIESELRATLTAPGRISQFEHQLQHALGEWRLFESAAHAYRASDGSVRAVIYSRDVTARRRIEEQQLQARKMAAVRQLTGGLAQRVDALLAELAPAVRPVAPASSESPPVTSEAQIAVQRSGELTRQLLAFSRGPHLAPAVVNLNECLTDMEPVLQRELGKPVALEIRYSHTLWPTRVDAQELENAILQLARNACDAMSDSGRLIIETYNTTLSADATGFDPDLVAGDYTVLGVVDDGAGMPPDLLGQVFDPFFTTRDSMQRTGLGLSMVYGFAKQSGGQIRLRSQPGSGTVASLYLPRWREQSPAPEPHAGPARPAHGDETILVVDDDAKALMSVARKLETLGYRVLQAAGGAEALEHAELATADLAISEVALTHMPGTALARALAERDPAVPTLLMSGYAEVYADERRGDARELDLLQKPVDRLALAARVRAALDARTPHADGAARRLPSRAG